VKVALGGDGGDELFGGYDRYRALRAGEKLDLIPWPLRRVLAAGGALPAGHPKAFATRVRRFFAAADLSTPQRYEQFLRLFPEHLLAELLPSPFNRHWPVADMMETRTELDPVVAASRWTASATSRTTC
jgi:asparagine synthase (glutamine-hydrolysing)